jgi:abortive infection bacteriophage resistance protein
MRKRDAASGSVLDGFADGTTFKEVTDLYTFDGRLRLIMLDALERLGISLHTEVVLQLGEMHPHAHSSYSR